MQDLERGESNARKASRSVASIALRVSIQQHLYRTIDPQPVAQIGLPQSLLRLISSKTHLYNAVDGLIGCILMRGTLENVHLRGVLLGGWVVGANGATTAVTASAVARAARIKTDDGFFPDVWALRAESRMIWEGELRGRLGKEDWVLDDGWHGACNAPPIKCAGPRGSGWCGQQVLCYHSSW